MKKGLLEKIQNRSAQVAVVGLGYVGLPLALRFSEGGYRVIGIDIDAEKVAQLATGRDLHRAAYGAERVAAALKKGFKPTANFARRGARRRHHDLRADAAHRAPRARPELTCVRHADALVPHLRAGQLVSLESTTYPGTTEEEIVPRIEKRGPQGRPATSSCVSRPSAKTRATRTSRRTRSPRSAAAPRRLASRSAWRSTAQAIDQVVPVSSTRAAEMTKLLENIHRAVNIGLVNEMKIICDRMGIDIHEVIRAAATKPFGFVPYYPGPGSAGTASRSTRST